MGHLDPAVGLKAEVAPPHHPIQDLQSHLAPIQGHDHDPAPDHDPIYDRSPEAEAGPTLLVVGQGQGQDQDLNLTPREGDTGPDLAVPLLPLLLVWALTPGLLYLIQDLEKKIKGIKC